VDGFHNDFELAVIVSNDSDLLEPIKVVSQVLKKPVGLLNPQVPKPGVIASCHFYQTDTERRAGKEPISP
jgi:hypothetical protein